jgi:hypothetical protein
VWAAIQLNQLKNTHGISHALEPEHRFRRYNGGRIMDNALFYTPDVVCVIQTTKHFSEVRDPDHLHQRLFNLNHRGADVKRNPGRPVTCNAWAPEERRMLRRTLGVSLLTVLQGKMESRRCLVGFEACQVVSRSYRTLNCRF